MLIRRVFQCSTIATLGLVLWANLPLANADTLQIDLGLTPQTPANGFQSFAVAMNNFTSPASQNYTSTLGTANSVTVSLATTGTNGARLRSAVSHPESEMYRDVVFAATGMTLTLGNLQAGSYYALSYHHDNDFAQDTFNVNVTDALATSNPRYANVSPSTGTTPNLFRAVPLSFQVNGSGNVSLNYADATSDTNPFVVISGLKVTNSLPSQLRVDVGAAGAGNDVQAGFEEFTFTSGTLTPPRSNWYFSEQGNEGSVLTTLSTSSGSFDTRDRADTSGSLGDLAEDFVFSSAGGEVTLTLDKLQPGVHTITTYHHDTDRNDHGDVNITASDALGVNQLKAAGVVQTGATTNPTEIGSSTFTVVSNGVDLVVISMQEAGNGANPLVVFNGFESSSVGDSLRVDFGQSSASNNDVQNRWQSFDASASDTAFNGPVTRSYNNPLGTDGSIEVTVRSQSGSLGTRDRGNLMTDLGNVGEDFVNSFGSTYLEMVLDDLLAGEYVLTTYHHDNNVAQGEIDISVFDALGSDRSVATDLVMSSGTATDPASATFLIEADGLNPVTVRFSRDVAGVVVLNGFSLTALELAVPEPSSLATFLIVGGVAGFFAFRRIRRR